MGQKKNLGSILLATTSFVGGIAAGLLLAPEKGSRNRAWLSKHATELVNWVNTQGKAARFKSNRELKNFRRNIHQGIKRNVPNLYEATENIDLSDKDIISE